jgi:hypothetical protein
MEAAAMSIVNETYARWTREDKEAQVLLEREIQKDVTSQEYSSFMYLRACIRLCTAPEGSFTGNAAIAAQVIRR